MRSALLAGLVILAGCASDEPRPIGAGLPADWQSGAALHPHEMSGDHGGGRGATLHPPAWSPAPESCLAYRDAMSQPGDACRISEPRYSWEAHLPWLVRASWASCPTHNFSGCDADDYPKPYEARVVAFDALGKPIAWWDGHPADGTQFVTE